MATIPNIRATYAMALRYHAHELVALGYQRMNNSRYVDWEEPAITGELIRFIREVMESDSAPAWAVYYAIGDDPPLNVAERYGKSRSRVDIEFERTGVRGPRPRLRFEAKRLGKTKEHTVSAYLGADGMGCFISGKYPLTHEEAGMLGYVQSGSEKEWSDQVENALTKKGPAYSTVPPPYQQQNVCSLKYTYVSHHSSLSPKSIIVILARLSAAATPKG